MEYMLLEIYYLGQKAILSSGKIRRSLGEYNMSLVPRKVIAFAKTSKMDSHYVLQSIKSSEGKTHRLLRESEDDKTPQ